MFGSGKTALARRLLDFSNPRVKAAFLERQEHGDFGVAPLANALTVTIDLQQHLLSYGRPVAPHDLQFFLAKLVWRCTLTRFEGVTPEAVDALWDKHIMSLRDCVTTLTTALDCPLLLHFDEVGMIEDATWAGFFAGNTSDVTDLLRSIRFYHTFWSELVPLLRHDRAFLYLTGKSSALSLMGRGLLGVSHSPGKVQQLTLGCFEIKDLRDLVKPLAGADFLDLSSDDVEREFLEWLHRLTGGVARLTCYVLDSLLKNKYTARHVMDHDTAYLKVLAHVRTAPGGSLSLEGLSATQRTDLEPVLVAAACNLVLELDAVIPGCTLSVEALAMRYHLYMSRVGPTAVKLVMPGVWREQLKGAVDHHWRFIAAIPSQLADSGEALEHITGTVILLRARMAEEKARAADVYPLLANTKASLCHVSGMMSMYSRKRATAELMREHAEDGRARIVAWAKGSPSGDRLMVLPLSDSLPVLVEPQCKNTVFSVDGLRDEIAKCNTALSMVGGTKPCASSVVLLIIATELTAGMAEMANSAVWKAGRHVVAKPYDLTGKQKKLKGVQKMRALQRSKGEIVIPKGLEVVVASKEQVMELLGQQQFSVAIATRRNGDRGETR
jgi:hypothetical protein